MTTGNDKLDEALRKLRKALVGLNDTDWRAIARRNARHQALGALRRVRTVIDDQFPAIIKRGGVVRLKTLEGRMARLARKGWRPVDHTTAALFAAAGVRIMRVEGKRRGSSFLSTTYYGPGWAVAIGPTDYARLRAAKKSITERGAALAAEALARR